MEKVRLRALSLVEEGRDVLVGDPVTGTFVAMPAVGRVVIEALRRGATVEEAAREAEEFAGEPVDVPGFVETLRELGFVEDGTAPSEAARTAPVQARRWSRAVRPGAARPLFGRVAWTVYAACALFDLVTLIREPSLLPRPGTDAFVFDDVGTSILVFYPFALAVMAVHECWHWLAARAAGVSARFGVDRRAVFLVFETDLSQLWAVPRRQRIGPLLAGMAVDASLLACLLIVRMVAGSGGLAGSVAAAWSYLLVTNLAWQCMVFLRTDLYAVLVTVAGCRNLWRVKTLMLRRAFGRLSASEDEELRAADPADLRVGSWFRWLWLAGFGGVALWAVLLMAPILPPIAEWTVTGLAEGPSAWGFWAALGGGALAFGPWAAVLVLAGVDQVRKLAAALEGASRSRRP